MEAFLNLFDEVEERLLEGVEGRLLEGAVDCGPRDREIPPLLETDC